MAMSGYSSGSLVANLNAWSLSARAGSLGMRGNSFDQQQRREQIIEAYFALGEDDIAKRVRWCSL